MQGRCSLLRQPRVNGEAVHLEGEADCFEVLRVGASRSRCEIGSARNRGSLGDFPTGSEGHSHRFPSAVLGRRG